MADEKKHVDPLEAQLEALLNQVDGLNKDVEPAAQPAPSAGETFDGILSQADLDALLEQAAEQPFDQVAPAPPPTEPPAARSAAPTPATTKPSADSGSIGQDDIDALLNATESLKQELVDAQKPAPPAAKPGALRPEELNLADTDRGSGSELDDGLADDEPSPPQPKAKSPTQPSEAKKPAPAAPKIEIPKELDIDLDAEAKLAAAAASGEDIDQVIAQAGTAGQADDLDIGEDDDAIADAEISEAFGRISEAATEDTAGVTKTHIARHVSRSAMPTPIRWILSALASIDYLFSWIPANTKNILGVYAIATLLLGVGLWALLLTRDNSSPLFATRVTTLPPAEHKEGGHSSQENATPHGESSETGHNAPADAEHQPSALSHEQTESPADHGSKGSSAQNTSPSETETQEPASSSHEPAPTQEH